MLACQHNDQQQPTSTVMYATTMVDDESGFSPDVDEVSELTKRELLALLERRLRRGKIPVTTMNYWIVQSGVGFKSFYLQSDLDLITSFARWIDRGGKTKTFHELRRKSLNED